MNIGGANFTNLNTTIQSNDPYLTITDNSGYFGSLLIDSTKENTSDPYTVYASPSSPDGHPALCQLIATDGSFADTIDFTIIIGRIHYYVWNPDPTPGPGEIIHSTLGSIGYTGNYGVTLPTSDLDYYSAVFVCVGIYASNYIISASSAEATALVDYVNNGGRMYLEGGDVWYYDPPYQGGYDFGSLFGIDATADGTSDAGPFAGQSGTFTTGMNFAYAGENSYIDHISPTGTGFLIFYDTDNAYDAGVANDAGSYRTVGTSFELGGLVDGSGVSTRAALLDSIMHFFGIGVVGIEEVTKTHAGVMTLQPYPNPFRDRVEIQYTLPSNTQQVQFKIFDATGRLVRNLLLPTAYSLVPTVISWDGQDASGTQVASGIYFVQMETENQRAVKKVILVE